MEQRFSNIFPIEAYLDSATDPPIPFSSVPNRHRTHVDVDKEDKGIVTRARMSVGIKNKKKKTNECLRLHVIYFIFIQQHSQKKKPSAMSQTKRFKEIRPLFSVPQQRQ